jgi:hypothetical protein
MHWAMLPADMPMGEDMPYGPGDMEGPMLWWGEFNDCIVGLK